MASRPAEELPALESGNESGNRVSRHPGPDWYHSIQLPDGRVMQGAQTLDQLRRRVAQFPLPQDLQGKTLLDIGAWDGWFSFEMERRGARVTAVDCIEQPGFLLAKERLGSRVDYHVMDVYDLSAGSVGPFDIVLFLGVLYHLKHPLLGLEEVCALTKQMACIESYVTDDGASILAGGPAERPAIEFYETDELRGQLDNWCGPNAACLLAMCRTAGFVRVELRSVIDHRAHVVAYRCWDPPPANPSQPPPKLVEAVNLRTGKRYLSSSADDYVSIWFKTPETGLDRGSVFPTVGGYGIQPVYVGRTEDDGWQANCKLPPGLVRGWHEVRVRTANGAYSSPVEIAVDEERQPPRAGHLQIEIVADGKTWERNHARLSSDCCVSIWLAGMPRNAEREDIRVQLGDTELEVTFLSSPDESGRRQVNARVPVNMTPGEFALVASCAGVTCSPAKLELLPAGPG
jgi:tRNA (mo5U34)-methyltransferase